MNKKHKDILIGSIIAIIFFTSLKGAEGFACSLIGCILFDAYMLHV